MNRQLRTTALWIIGAGTLLRVILALARHDLVWPDEHFMNLEPASKIVFGRAFLAWEWTDGYRSWTLPLVYVPVLWLCKVIGVSGGLFPIHASRVFTALFSGFALYRFNQTLLLLRLRPLARLVTLAAFSLATPMVLWGATTLGDNWILIAWLCLLPSLIRLSRERSSASWFKLGALAGILILIKAQAGIFALALGLGFLVQKKTIRQLGCYGLGVLVNPLMMGLLDWVTYGKPFSALIKQATRGEVISRFYGVAPWYDYFPKILADQSAGFAIAVGLAVPVLLLRWQKTARLMRARGPALWMALGPALLFVIFHIMIPHKETRFLLPALPAFYLMIGLAVQVLAPRLRVPAIALPALILVTGAASLSLVMKAPTYLQSVNIAPLEAKIYQLRTGNRGMKDCLLLLEHHFSWTRGRLILGDGVEVIEKRVSELPAGTPTLCSYAILPADRAQEFQARMGAPSWNPVAQARSGFVLLQRGN